MVGCHPKLEIFSESIGNHFLLLSVASKPLEHYFLGILEFEAQCEDYTIYQKCNQLLTENMYQNIIQKDPLY